MEEGTENKEVSRYKIAVEIGVSIYEITKD